MAEVDPKFREALEQVTRAAERYAQRGRVALQPDEAVRRHVLRGLARNLVRYGRAYCPCREAEGDPEVDRVNICPCRTHLEEIARFGECECGLFVTPESGREAAGSD
jgi:ferredoxin-thioredoxin reductase catalytic chain